MLQGLLSKFGRKLKTRRRSDLDCTDFVNAVPHAPSHKHIRSVVAERLYGKKSPAGSEAEELQRDYAIRATTFDLQYRCGAAGRCVGCDDGAQPTTALPQCRFPRCFTMRPLTKGAEILAERVAYEVEGVPDAAIRSIVDLARNDDLDGCQAAIAELVKAKIRGESKGRTLASVLEDSSDVDGTPAEIKMGPNSKYGGENPLRTNEALREEVISLYLWRAALLVNLRRDEQAVNSLLNLAFALEGESRLRLFVAAAGWATLNDMEIVYYRNFIQQYDAIAVATEYATQRPTLLRRVFEVCKDDFFVQHAAHQSFAKEITALVSRAQAAQMHGDATEDPMTTFCIPIALQYYRFFVSPSYWQHFFNLLVMPPAESAASGPHDEPLRDMNLTPAHVLDAIGRSIMLHHLLLLHDGREKERVSGKFEDFAEASSKDLTMEQLAKMESFLDGRSAVLARTRMRDLLGLIRSHEASKLAGGTPGQVLPPNPQGQPAPQGPPS